MSQQLSLPLDEVEFTVRVSRRAKYAALKVSPVGQVEVVIPRGFDPGKVPAFVAQHRQWVNKTVARMMRARDPRLNEPQPRKIHLAAVGEHWWVSYENARRNGFRAQRSTDGQHLLQVNTAGPGQAGAVLRKWLAQRAKPELAARLQQLSEETGLVYKKLTVRAQKTRWGSCSSQKHISLNRALMFLPPDVVHYLLIHELCHTVHLNHSAAYWRLVRRWAPQYKQYEKALNRYSLCIPVWAYTN
jgi:predicted metal-dependent hydrolase